MIEKKNSIKGVNSVFVPNIYKWQYIENLFKSIINLYAYDEIKLQLLEDTKIFDKSLGINSDIVNKEMFSFYDKNGKSITLIPEGTATCTKFLCNFGFLRTNNFYNLWYFSPMFRREKPQKYRSRLFYQIGIESYGYKCFSKELEHIIIFKRFLVSLNIFSVTLELNCLDFFINNVFYEKILFNFFFRNLIDKSCLSRLNVMRVLDKSSVIKNIIIPKFLNFLSIEKRRSFFKFLYILKKMNISFLINNYLVRGLDYYNGIIYEWTVKGYNDRKIAVAAGGRYDYLSKKFSKLNVFSTGFAIGFERIVSIYLDDVNIEYDAFIFFDDIKNIFLDLKFLEYLRDMLNVKKLIYSYNKKFLKKNFNLIKKGKIIYKKKFFIDNFNVL